MKPNTAKGSCRHCGNVFSEGKGAKCSSCIEECLAQNNPQASHEMRIGAEQANGGAMVGYSPDHRLVLSVAISFFSFVGVH